MKSYKSDFNIKLIDIYWLEGVDPKQDLCAHGHVYFCIGDKVICDIKQGSFTVSSISLYLL